MVFLSKNFMIIDSTNIYLLKHFSNHYSQYIVDDLLMICKNKKMIEEFVDYLLTCFSNVTVHNEVQQTYLGMLITKEIDGGFSVSMEEYIEKVIKVYELSVDLTVKDPQHNIFKINGKSALLNESRKKKFHKVVYMLVY